MNLEFPLADSLYSLEYVLERHNLYMQDFLNLFSVTIVCSIRWLFEKDATALLEK